MIRNVLCALCALAPLLLLWALPAQGQGNAAQANNPLANTQAMNFQNQYTGNLSGIDEDANQFFLRYAAPFEALGGSWLARLTVPVNRFPDGRGTTSGLGDTNLFAAYLMDTGNPAISFGIGPQLTAPTATDDALGSEQWSVGFANVLFNASSPVVQWGYLLTWQTSVAGNDDRADISLAAIQPFAFYQLGGGWYLRSAATSTYDFESDSYALPIGFGLGKVTKGESAVVNVFVEPQFTLFDKGPGQSEWGVFAGVNFQF